MLATSHYIILESSVFITVVDIYATVLVTISKNQLGDICIEYWHKGEYFLVQVQICSITFHNNIRYRLLISWGKAKKVSNWQKTLHRLKVSVRNRISWDPSSTYFWIKTIFAIINKLQHFWRVYMKCIPTIEFMLFLQIRRLV